MNETFNELGLYTPEQSPTSDNMISPDSMTDELLHPVSTRERKHHSHGKHTRPKKAPSPSSMKKGKFIKDMTRDQLRAFRISEVKANYPEA